MTYETLNRIFRILYYIAVICCILYLMRGCEQPSWADCKGLTPRLQKAYDQLKKDGFDVSCEQGRKI